MARLPCDALAADRDDCAWKSAAHAAAGRVGGEGFDLGLGDDEMRAARGEALAGRFGCARPGFSRRVLRTPASEPASDRRPPALHRGPFDRAEPRRLVRARLNAGA